jgi:amino-acid N-acetyltransferase
VVKTDGGRVVVTAGDVGVQTVRKAVIRDVDTIQKMVNRLASEGAMLAIALSEIFEHIRDFWVVEKNGDLVGTCALHVIWEDLGEIRSLAVDPCCRDLGVGRALVEKCLEEAAGLHLRRVFALTYQEEFFQRMGFEVVNKDRLPHKVWRDCMKCTKFPNCDETAVMKVLEEER